MCTMSSRVALASPPAGGAPLANEESFNLPSRQASFKLPLRPPASAAPVVVCLYKATDCATDLYDRFQDSPLWQVQVQHEAPDEPSISENGLKPTSTRAPALTGKEGLGPTGVPNIARGRRVGPQHVSRGRSQGRRAAWAHESPLGDHRAVRPRRTSGR